MKTMMRSDRGRAFKLLIDVPGLDDDDKPVLAKIEIQEGTGCWTIQDVRLSEFGRPSKLFDVGGEAFCSSHEVQTPEELAMFSQCLNEYQIKPTADGGAKISWCTFNGIVRGKTPEALTGIKNFSSTSVLQNEAIYFKRHEALEYLKTAADDWSRFAHSESDPDIAELAGEVKLNNPVRQPAPIKLIAVLYAEKNYRPNTQVKKPKAGSIQDLHAQLVDAAKSNPDASEIEILVGAGAPVNGVHGNGVPLREIVIQNRVYNIPKLIACGANLNALYGQSGKDDVDGIDGIDGIGGKNTSYPWPTALHLAVEYERDIAVVQLLGLGADPHLRLPGGLSALELAQKSGLPALMDAFTHPLQVAASLDMRQAAIGLVRLGHNPNDQVSSKSFGHVGKKKCSAIARADALGYKHTADALRALSARQAADKAGNEFKASHCDKALTT